MFGGDAWQHGEDYWDSAERAYEEGGSESYSCRKSNFKYNPYYYHQLVEFDELKVETKKACMFIKQDYHEGEMEFWVPKALCKNLDKESKTVYILRKFVRDNLDWMNL